MAKETKDLETTKNKATKKTVSSSKKTTKKSTSSSKKTVSKEAASSTKKVVSKKATPEKKATTKKKSISTTKKVADKKKKTTDTKKATTSKKATTTKKTATKKSTATAKKATTKKTASKKTVIKKTEPSVRKNSTKKKTEKVRKTVEKKSVKNFTAEYYDLPFMYNRTIVKVLAQTPKMLFIYWEISEEDRDLFKRIYGENFFNHTKPILIVYNDTMNYSFEVEVDDFANSWYLHINDANCEYHVELGRKPIPNINYQNQPIYIPYYVYVTSSNEMTSPNNTIMFNPNLRTLRFRNVKTGEVIDKDISQFIFVTNFGIFNIKDLYKYLFPNESFEFENIVLGNTSSGALSSSGMFSSQFK